MRLYRLLIVAVVALAVGIAPGTAGAVTGGRIDSMSDAQISGEAPNDELGTSLALVGDVNGDGFDDAVLGAPLNGGGNTGAAYLVLGSANGWGLRKLANQTPFVELDGTSANDIAGTSVSAAGDVNGDGFDDFLVGAPGRDDGAGLNQGVAYLVLGSAAPTTANLSTFIKYSGQSLGDQAGFSVGPAGDVNGDGFDDFLVGAPIRNDGAGVGQGAAYLVLGSAAPASASLSTAIKYSGEAAGDNAGWSVGSAGDEEDDGLADYIVGAPGNNADRGAAYKFDGNATPTGGTLGTAGTFSFEITGEAAGDQFGWSVSGAGDPNADGFDDYLIGAPINNPGGAVGAGAAYLIVNRPGAIANGTTNGVLAAVNLSAVKYFGEATGDNAGTSVAGAGDVNGDGFDDLLVGAPLEGTSDKGAVYVVLGSGTLVGGGGGSVKYTGQLNNDQLGSAVAGGHDLNGDGAADLLAGSTDQDIVFSQAGAGYVVFGDEPTPENPGRRERHGLTGTAANNNFPVLFEPGDVRVDFNASVARDGDVSVDRLGFHPCSQERLLATPMWNLDTTKLQAGGNAVLRFKYNNDQIAGETEANLKLWTRPAGQPCAAWTQVAGSTLDTTHNYISATVTTFGQFTVAELQPPTSVEVLEAIPTHGATWWKALIALVAVGAVAGRLFVLHRRRRVAA